MDGCEGYILEMWLTSLNVGCGEKMVDKVFGLHNWVHGDIPLSQSNGWGGMHSVLDIQGYVHWAMSKKAIG